jgi:WD40 repeat protein
MRLERETDATILASPVVAELTPDKKHLVCGRSSIWLCDLTSHFERYYSKPSSSGVANLFITRKGLVIGQVASAIRVWQWRTGKLKVELKPACHHHLASVDVAGKRALTVSYAPTQNRSFTVWDLGRTRALGSFTEKKSFVIGAALSADGATVVHGGTDGIVRFFDVGSSTQFARSPGKGWIDVVVRSDDGRFFASGGRGGFIHVWKPDGTLHKRVPHPARVVGLAFSPDGTLLITHGTKRPPVVWDVASGKQAATLDAEGVRCVRFSSDGTRIVTVAGDLHVSVWRFA